MINKDTVFAVIGLGVLGGSYVEGLSQKGYSCIGVDINEESIAYAKEKGWIVKGGSDPSIVKEADIVISCLYPHAFVKWIKENQQYIKHGALLSDVTGVKRNVIENINAILREDIEFIACHPMAGKVFCLRMLRNLKLRISLLFQQKKIQKKQLIRHISLQKSLAFLESVN